MAFVGLTVLLRQLTAQSMSFLAMLLPFGALLFGAALYDEALTWRALAGALLVAIGLLIAQGRGAPTSEAPAPPRRRVQPPLREGRGSPPKPLDSPVGVHPEVAAVFLP